MGVCEERGSGWDKVASQVEVHHLPAPEVTTTDETMRVTLLNQRSLGDMTGDERAAAVYLHACLNQVSRLNTTNSSVRERFGIEEPEQGDGVSTAEGRRQSGSDCCLTTLTPHRG